MKARILLLFVFICLVSTAVLAHGGEDHVMGTVTTLTQDSISVNTTANKIVTVVVAPATKFLKDKISVKIADLKVGDRVVIHAKEPVEGKLVADTVEFATPQETQAAGSKRSTQ